MAERITIVVDREVAELIDNGEAWENEWEAVRNACHTALYRRCALHGGVGTFVNCDTCKVVD